MGKTILIVEDDALNRKLFNDVLQANGYRTVLATDDADVEELAARHGVDLIIVDLRLPGQSGLELVRSMRAKVQMQSIPIIAVTDTARRSDDRMIRAAGFDVVLAQPVSIPTLLRTVAECLGSDTTSGAA